MPVQYIVLYKPQRAASALYTRLSLTCGACGFAFPAGLFALCGVVRLIGEVGGAHRVAGAGLMMLCIRDECQLCPHDVA